MWNRLNLNFYTIQKQINFFRRKIISRTAGQVNLIRKVPSEKSQIYYLNKHKFWIDWNCLIYEKCKLLVEICIWKRHSENINLETIKSNTCNFWSAIAKSLLSKLASSRKCRRLHRSWTAMVWVSYDLLICVEPEELCLLNSSTRSRNSVNKNNNLRILLNRRHWSSQDGKINKNWNSSRFPPCLCLLIHLKQNQIFV